MILLFTGSFYYGSADNVEVVGTGECADCKENNIKTSHALLGTMNYLVGLLLLTFSFHIIKTVFVSAALCMGLVYKPKVMMLLC